MKLFQVDAFARRLFGGNPAAVVPLDAWPDNGLLQAIAGENNLSETAYLVGGNGRYHLRWFTPTTEVKLCGHATLAAAFIVFERLEPGREEVVFDTLSGPLTVTRAEDVLTLDFPAETVSKAEPPAWVGIALRLQPREVFVSSDLLAVFGSEAEVRALAPDMEALRVLGETYRGLIATAPGDEVDFVSRFFAPGAGIAEDPVTGSAHCILAPFWSERLGKTTLTARQVSARGGDLRCEVAGNRVRISGGAVLYLEGEIHVPA